MAELESKYPTMLDIANATDPDGKIAGVVEILHEVSSVIEDMVYVEGNLDTGHKTTIRTGIPIPAFRKMYGFTQPTKGTVASIIDTTGMIEDYAEVDAALVDLADKKAAYRLQEDRAHIEGIAQLLTDTIWYGSENTTPESFTGFTPRYNDLAATNSRNIINAGGVGADNGSIWLIGWGKNSVHGILLKGSKAGTQMNDKGQETKQNPDGSGGMMEVYRTHYKVASGLCVRDWRYAVRICNIDKSLLSLVYTAGAFATGANLPELMFQATELLENVSNVKASFYMSRTMRTVFRQQCAVAVQNSTLTIEDVGGKKLMHFDGIPVKISDALSADETLVS